MAEQFKSITAARKELPSLSQTVQSGGDLFVITNQGKPQAVLLGYGEYKGLMAALELLNRPRDLEHLKEGLAQTQRLSFEKLKENLTRRKAALSEDKTAPTMGAAMEPTPTRPIDKRLDEISGHLEQIIARLVNDKWVLLPEEGLLESRKSNKEISYHIVHKAKPGEEGEGVCKVYKDAQRQKGIVARASVAAQAKTKAAR